MAREQYLIGVDVEELQNQQKPPEPPMTFKEKLAKFWYLHKVAVILVVCVAVLIAGLAVLIRNKETYDYTLVTVTKGILSDGAREELAKALAECGEDLDGDGDVRVQIIPLAMTDQGDYVELSTIFSGGTALFFAMEPTYYEEQIEAYETEDNYYFTPLSAEHPGLSANKRYWNWADSDAFAAMTNGFPQQWYFGVRQATGTASGRKNEQANKDCVALLEKFIENASVHGDW